MSRYDTMYVYDIIPKNKSEIYKIKRKFYYNLSKMEPFIRRTTKSVIVTTKEHERILDSFFLQFKGDVSVYKCKIRSIEILKSD
ncbi:MAG: hypothetical protein QXU54_00410 [Candidatus Micrarchaeia archaeon]